MKLKDFIIQHYRIILIQSILLIVALLAYSSLTSKSDNIYIACVFDGNKSTNTEKLELLQVYEDMINNKEGLDGKELRFKSYFYNGNLEEGKKLSDKIFNDYKFATVFLDFNYKIDKSFLKKYEDNNIPIIMTKINEDINSSVLFQMIPSKDKYGKYMAFYSHHILKYNYIDVIHTKIYDETLVKSFVDISKRMGSVITNNIILDDNIDDIVNKFKLDVNKTNNVILMDGENKDIIPLIVALKRADIHIPIIVNKPDIGHKFDGYKEEQNLKGYFSRNIISTSIISQDSLNEHMSLIIKNYNIQSKKKTFYALNNLIYSLSTIFDYSFPKDIKDTETLRKDILDNLKKDQYFDENQQAIISLLRMIKYERQNLVTMPIDPIKVIESSISRVYRKNIIKINEENEIYPTDIVHTGITMKNISNINMSNMTYDMEFYLWFRYRDGVDNAEDIEFLNTKNPARLLELVSAKDDNTTMSAKLINRVVFNKDRYSLYHIKGKFISNEISNYALGKQNLEISFRNSKKNLYELSYAYDFINTNNGLFSLEDTTKKVNENIIDELKFDALENPSLELNYNYSYISMSYKSEFGNPLEIFQSNDFSKVIIKYNIQHVLFSVRGIQAWINTILPGNDNEIKVSAMIMFVSLCFMVLLFIIYIRKNSIYKHTSTYLWFLQLLVIFFILLFIEFAISQTLFDIKYSIWGKAHLSTIKDLILFSDYTIAILWWLLPAYYLTSAFEQFLWEPIRMKTGSEVPNVLILFVTTTVYLLAIGGIMAFVFELTTTSLAATSGFIAIMLAVASKIDLSNIIAGLGISFSKVFVIGDWVKIGDVEGQIVEMTPKSTKLQTFSSSIINIPNTTVSSATIENYNRPEGAYRLMIHLETVADYRFEDVERVILDAIYSTEGVLKTPKPSVMFHGQGDSSQIYKTFFFIDDYSKKALLWQRAWRRIWRHLEMENIILATPQREIFMPKVSEEEISFEYKTIKNSIVFDKLSDAKKLEISNNLESKDYYEGTQIEEDMENNICIVANGAIAMLNKNSDNELKYFGTTEVLNLNDEDKAHRFICKRDSKIFLLNKKYFSLLDTYQSLSSNKVS